MKIRIFLFFICLVIYSRTAYAQQEGIARDLQGFIRAGLYANADPDDDKLQVPSAFSDLAFKIRLEDNKMFRAFADLRFRYGTEFNAVKKDLDLREAYAGIYGKTWDLSAGQQIIKWGKADFMSGLNKISPRNLVSRSPDPEDMDMGNLLLRGRWFPAKLFNIEIVAEPYYRPSELMIKPIRLPSYITITQPGQLVTDKSMFSYGLRAGLQLKIADIGISWFDGYDPMPGTALTSFTLDMSGGFPIPLTVLTLTPYKIQNAGVDFESTVGSFGLRGELVWTIPEVSWEKVEYVACEQLQWSIGTDHSSGDWQFLAEYSGKFLPDFKPATVEPMIGTEPDLAALAALMAVPGFDLREYVRQQIGSFNRLYNYQLKEFYHNGSVKVSRDILYGIINASITGMYNFTTRDLMLRPELSWKPADGLTINLGGEFFSGKKGSVFDIVDEFLNGVFFSIKAEF